MPVERTQFGRRYFITGPEIIYVSADRTERIRPWGDNAGAWVYRPGARWGPFIPAIDLPDLERKAAADQAARFLVEAWPEEARTVVRPLPKPHWEPLQLINLGGRPARELLASHPVIGLLLAWRRVLAAHDSGLGDPNRVRELLSRRRREIAGVFGFPAAERTVRLLSQIPVDQVSPASLQRLRESLWPQPVSAPPPPPPRCRPFMKPPLAEVEGLAAILTAEDLKAEGKRMHHCAGAYVPDVLAGRRYFYRVLRPERATLCIQLAAGTWRVHDLRAACNRQVSRETREFVERWLTGQPEPPKVLWEPRPRIAPVRRRRPDARQLLLEFA